MSLINTTEGPFPNKPSSSEIHQAMRGQDPISVYHPAPSEKTGPAMEYNGDEHYLQQHNLQSVSRHGQSTQRSRTTEHLQSGEPSAKTRAE